MYSASSPTRRIQGTSCIFPCSLLRIKLTYIKAGLSIPPEKGEHFAFPIDFHPPLTKTTPHSHSTRNFTAVWIFLLRPKQPMVFQFMDSPIMAFMPSWPTTHGRWFWSNLILCKRYGIKTIWVRFQNPNKKKVKCCPQHWSTTKCWCIFTIVILWTKYMRYKLCSILLNYIQRNRLICLSNMFLFISVQP